MLDKAELEQLVSLRHKLHQNPELSGQEKVTSQIIRGFLEQYQPDKIIENIGGHGLAALYDSQQPGPSICIRCDLDALPIEEKNNLEYRSENHGIAHKCGHDGHMSIVGGLAILLAKSRPSKGKVVLLYQPAEETGEGADRVLEDERFKQLDIDYFIGLHNLPGFPECAIVFREGVFAASSKGMIIKLRGATSHAAEPENGRSPAIAMAEIIKQIEELPGNEVYESFVLTTVIHAELGKIAFGTTPGYAEVRATLRSYYDADINKLAQDAEKLIKKFCDQYQLDFNISYTEVFPATESDVKLVELLRKIIMDSNIEGIEIDKPFRWSEDFGHYKTSAPALFFGLGAGDIPNLHNSDYDFPDKIISTGTFIFFQLCKSLLEKQ